MVYHDFPRLKPSKTAMIRRSFAHFQTLSPSAPQPLKSERLTFPMSTRQGHHAGPVLALEFSMWDGNHFHRYVLQPNMSKYV